MPLLEHVHLSALFQGLLVHGFSPCQLFLDLLFHGGHFGGNVASRGRSLYKVHEFSLLLLVMRSAAAAAASVGCSVIVVVRGAASARLEQWLLVSGLSLSNGALARVFEGGLELLSDLVEEAVLWFYFGNGLWRRKTEGGHAGSPTGGGVPLGVGVPQGLARGCDGGPWLGTVHAGVQAGGV